MSNTLINKNLKWLYVPCIKSVNDLYQTDFIQGEMYQIESIEDDYIYMISEDGSSVQFEHDEIKTYFDIN